MNRRTFLKRASGLVVAVAAPMFIPSERLDFGVPRRQLVAPEPSLSEYRRALLSHMQENPRMFDLPPGYIKFQESGDGITWTNLGGMSIPMNVNTAPAVIDGHTAKPYVRLVRTMPSTLSPSMDLPGSWWG